MPRVPIASEDERKFIVDGIQVRIDLPFVIDKNSFVQLVGLSKRWSKLPYLSSIITRDRRHQYSQWIMSSEISKISLDIY